MCGRYTLRTGEVNDLLEFYETHGYFQWSPRYNIAPSQNVPVIRLIEGVRQADSLRWGLIPPWAKDAKIGYRMINARSEEIARSYQAPLKKRRCLVMTDGWYEWREKSPVHFRFPGNRLFAFAGIWERWQEVESVSIFTTSSTGVASQYHDRMPVILDRDAYDPWLDPTIEGQDLVSSLLIPWEGVIEALPANPIVGNVRNETPECLWEGKN